PTPRRRWGQCRYVAQISCSLPIRGGLPTRLFRMTRSVGEETTTRRERDIWPSWRLYFGINPACLCRDCHRNTRRSRHAYFKTGAETGGRDLDHTAICADDRSLSNATVCSGSKAPLESGDTKFLLTRMAQPRAAVAPIPCFRLTAARPPFRRLRDWKEFPWRRLRSERGTTRLRD